MIDRMRLKIQESSSMNYLFSLRLEGCESFAIYLEDAKPVSAFTIILASLHACIASEIQTVLYSLSELVDTFKS